MALVVIRCVFLMVAIALGFQLSNSPLVVGPGKGQMLPWFGFLGILLVAAGVLAADVVMKRKKLDTITAVFFGTIIGLFLTYVFRLALPPLFPEADKWLTDWLGMALATIVCYSCISVLLQTKDD